MKASLYHFLVAAHRLERAGGREIADRWKRAELGDEARERLPLAVVQSAARHGEIGRRQHAVGNRFAVTEAPVLRDRLERVTDRVTEVEHPAQPRFALVG